MASFAKAIKVHCCKNFKMIANCSFASPDRKNAVRDRKGKGSGHAIDMRLKIQALLLFQASAPSGRPRMALARGAEQNDRVSTP